MAKEINTNTKATIKKMEEKITTPRTGLEGLEDDQRILNRFVSTIEHCVRRGVIKAKDELIRIRLGAEEYADADNNTVYLPKEVLDMRNSQVYWEIFQNVGKILLKKGKIQPLVSIDAFQVTEKLILDTAEEYAAVKAQCAIDMFAYGCQAYNQSPEFYVPNVTDKDIRKTSIFESVEELEFAVEKENSIRSIRRKAMTKAAQDSDQKAKTKTTRSTLEAIKDKKEELMSRKAKKDATKVQIPETTTSGYVDPRNLDESVISRFIKLNHLREVGGNFYTKIDFLIDTFLNEKRKNFKDTKKVKKKVTKTFKKEEPATDEAGNPILTPDGKQEMVTKTYTAEVEDEVSAKIEASEISKILCDYKDYMKFIETEYNLMNNEILISKSRPHRRLIINTFKYMIYNPGKTFNQLVEDQIRGSSIDRDVEFSVKAGIRVNKCRSYNDKLVMERERRFYIFKNLPEGKVAKDISDYGKLNENTEALAAFEKYLSVLPVEKTVNLEMYEIPLDIKYNRSRDIYNAIEELRKSNSI